MVQVIKRVKIDGEYHETKMALSDSEWKLLQEHYPQGNESFVLADNTEVKTVKPTLETSPEKQEDKAGREPDDDKPDMKNYPIVKQRAMDYFHEENWDKSLYYFEMLYKIKTFGWIANKMAQCKKNAAAER